MTDRSHPPLEEVLGFLRAAMLQRLEPRDALERLESLRHATPGLAVELVWEKPGYGEGRHYDALIDVPGGTVSLSFCPDQAIPWPLRGARRWDDGDLVRVNDQVVRVLDGISAIDFVSDEEPLAAIIIDACLLRGVLDAERIAPTEDQVQAAFDRFRLRRGLADAEETQAWLDRSGYTLERIEQYMIDEARVELLRERVVGDRVGALLERDLRGLDLALVAELRFGSADDARDALDELRRGARDFFGLAAARAAALREHGGAGLALTRTVLRRELPPPDADLIFGAAPGEVLGPFPARQEHRLVKVLGLVPAANDEPTRARAIQVLFEEWLAERRRAARIEWQWGRDSRAED